MLSINIFKKFKLKIKINKLLNVKNVKMEMSRLDESPSLPI